MENTKEKRPNLSKYKTIVVVTDAAYHTPVIVHLRKTFGKEVVWSAYGYGFRQFQAVVVNAPVDKVKQALAARSGVAEIKRWR